MRQPKALFLLASVQMWECFSFYGMRALLVLFITNKLQWDTTEALTLYGVYTAAVELGVLMGGFAADRFFGLRRAVLIGGGIIAAGHIVLSFGGFFTGLAFVAVGSALFKPNLKALLGQFYHTDDLRREAGFTLLYTGMNVGGFFAAILCGFAAKYWGWHAGFGLAAIGMVLGLIFLCVKVSLLEGKGEGLSQKRFVLPGLGIALWTALMMAVLVFPSISAPLLPLVGIWALKMCIDKGIQNMKGVLGLISLLCLYFCVEEWMGSLILLFSEQHADLESIPVSTLLAANPLAIVLLGPFVAKLSLKNPWKKIAMAFGLQALAFGVLCAFSLVTNGKVSAVVIGISFGVIALGELFIGPVVYAECSRIAPAKSQGFMMALVALGFAYGSLLSGLGAAWIHPDTRAQFSQFFGCVAAGSFAIACWASGRFQKYPCKN